MEANLLASLSHPNLVSALAVCTLQRPFFVVMELMDGGSLQSTLRKAAKAQALITDFTLLNVCSQICDALVYLSTLQIVHRDIAAR
jgi:serine/threonine protein kinase